MKAGAVQIQGLFSISSKFNATTRECSRISLQDLQLAQAMMYSIDELVNGNPSLLPGISVGWTIIDSCSSRDEAISMLSSSLMLSGLKNYLDMQCVLSPSPKDTSNFMFLDEKSVRTDNKHFNHSSAIGVIGDKIDNITATTASYTGSLGVCQVSYYSFNDYLNDRSFFPYFYRTSPPASIQSLAIIDILIRFNWNWISLVLVGNIPFDIITTSIEDRTDEFHLCHSLIERISDDYTQEDLARVVNKLKNQTSKVIVVIGSEANVYPFFKMAEALNLTGRTFIGSYTWLTSSQIYNISADIIEGAIGLKFKGRPLRKFQNYLQNLDLCKNNEKFSFIPTLKDRYPEFYNNSNNPINCKSKRFKSQLLKELYVPNYISIFVIDAVLALAHAFHNSLGCNSSFCPPLHTVNLNDLNIPEFLNNVQFHGLSSSQFHFGNDGNPNITLDIINLQRETILKNQTVKAIKIGYWSYEAGLVIDESKIIWNGNRSASSIPISRCAHACPPGFYKTSDRNIPEEHPQCCWKCAKCPKYTISNEFNQNICNYCSNETRPNQNRTQCIRMPILTIEWNDIISIVFYTAACMYLIVLISVWTIMIRMRDTPIVKGSNFTLVNVLLIFIALCLPASYLYLRPSSPFLCNARIILVSIMDLGILSTILCKTNQISVIFQNAINQDYKTAPLRKTSVQILFIAIILLINTGILTCILLSHPIRIMKVPTVDEYLEIICYEQISYSSIFQMSFSGLLGLMCVYLAFQTRSLPDNFNESRYIYLTSILIMAIKVISCPASFATAGIIQNSIILLSIMAFGVSPLLCLFIPKIYVIYYKPELNTKAEIMQSVTKYTFSRFNTGNKSNPSQNSIGTSHVDTST